MVESGDVSRGFLRVMGLDRSDVCALIPTVGAADTEIKVPSGENAELTRFPFKAWSRSVYSHTCYTYCHAFLLGLFIPFRSIHLLFFSPKSPPIFHALAVANTGSYVGLQNKIGHHTRCRLPY